MWREADEITFGKVSLEAPGHVCSERVKKKNSPVYFVKWHFIYIPPTDQV